MTNSLLALSNAEYATADLIRSSASQGTTGTLIAPSTWRSSQYSTNAERKSSPQTHEFVVFSVGRFQRPCPLSQSQKERVFFGPRRDIHSRQQIQRMPSQRFSNSIIESTTWEFTRGVRQHSLPHRHAQASKTRRRAS